MTQELVVKNDKNDSDLHLLKPRCLHIIFTKAENIILCQICQLGRRSQEKRAFNITF